VHLPGGAHGLAPWRLPQCRVSDDDDHDDEEEEEEEDDHDADGEEEQEEEKDDDDDDDGDDDDDDGCLLWQAHVQASPGEDGPGYHDGAGRRHAAGARAGGTGGSW
jgi:hypothetical protein